MYHGFTLQCKVNGVPGPNVAWFKVRFNNEKLKDIEASQSEIVNMTVCVCIFLDIILDIFLSHLSIRIGLKLNEI